MTSLGIFCAIALLLFICTTEALLVFQTVEGNCSSLPVLKEYDSAKAASGEWYFQYGTFGKEAKKCSSGHSVQRGTKNFVDLLLFDEEKNEFFNLSNDVTYDEARPGVYTNEQGIGYVLKFDPNKYFFYMQSMVVIGQTQVMAMLGTRSRQLKDEATKVLEEVSDTLAKIKLLPKIYRSEQTNCEFE